jgi:hypothetical protein
MDAKRFDNLVRSLPFFSSRRSVFVGLTSGLFASLPLLPGSEEVAGKKKRKKRKHKKKKKRTSCAPNCAGKSCGADGCGGSSPDCTDKTCGDDGCGGSCGACGSCQECHGGSCGPAPDDTPCADGGLCLNGTCNPFPNCLPSGNSCGGNPAFCCSGICDVGGTELCGPSGIDDPCLDDSHCSSNDCVGYRCR